jgi:glycosyltransferase involved in cell wall biosynthesis
VVVGANPPATVLALAGNGHAIEVTGRVGAVQPHLWRAAVAVAPLRTARGLQNKVLEALAAGLPVVLTSTVAAGLPAGVERGGLTADDADVFARHVVDLLGQSAAARRERAATAGTAALDWTVALSSTSRILAGAVASESRP